MEVCSIYLYEPRPECERLYMATTRASTRGRRRRQHAASTRASTGFVIEKGEPVMAIDALAHPRYKYFPETRRGALPLVPRRADRSSGASRSACWSCRPRGGAASPRDEVRLMKAVAVPVGGLLVQVRLLREPGEQGGGAARATSSACSTRSSSCRPTSATSRSRSAKPTVTARAAGRRAGASPGFGIGRAHLLRAGGRASPSIADSAPRAIAQGAGALPRRGAARRSRRSSA